MKALFKATEEKEKNPIKHEKEEKKNDNEQKKTSVV